MLEPGGPPIVCIGCGTANPPGSEVCSGCGHRFPGPAPSPDPVPAPAPSTRPAGPWRILAVGLMVALGSGLLYAAPIVGIGLLVAAVPAGIWTVATWARRRRSKEPLDAGDAVRDFALTTGRFFLVVVSSAIAFVMTCFPIGALGCNEEAGSSRIMLAFVVGLVAAAVAGSLTFRSIRKSAERRKPPGPDDGDRP